MLLKWTYFDKPFWVPNETMVASMLVTVHVGDKFEILVTHFHIEKILTWR